MRPISIVPNMRAAGALCALRHAGLDVVVVGGRLRVGPKELLTRRHDCLVRRYRDDLMALVCDEGTLARVETFRRQFRDCSPRIAPAFLFRAAPYAKGICFSCGVVLEELRYGRCWRCSVAWRLAARLPIAEEGAGGDDTASIVASREALRRMASEAAAGRPRQLQRRSTGSWTEVEKANLAEVGS